MLKMLKLHMSFISFHLIKMCLFLSGIFSREILSSHVGFVNNWCVMRGETGREGDVSKKRLTR